ncbi:MAG TPA: class I SAM-dependent methyltransferase [Acidimicrobiales bacterium]|nr:class I SAM-dependent methyltransferase [Acidimicrobiales bacterium]
MTNLRVRDRQGQVRLVGGVPYSDRRTTLSLLPGAAVGRWLASHRSEVGGLLLDLGAGNQPYRPWYGSLAEWCAAVDVAPSPGLSALSLATDVALRSSTFDTVVCTSVLEHVEDVESAVSEIVRLMKPGGRLLISVPFLYPTHEAPFDFWRTTHYGLRSLLERHGLVVEEVAAQGGPFLMAAHYVIQAGVQALSSASGRLGRWSWLLDNRVLTALIAWPQEWVRGLVGYRLTPLARIASLGYMACALRPGTTGDQRQA